MILELVFAGAMIPSYPTETLISSESSVPILFAHQMEYKNPYTCVKMIDNYLPKLKASEKIYLNTKNISPSTNQANGEDEIITPNTQYTDDYILALITKYSCLITSDQLDKASEVSNQIKKLNINNNNYPIFNLLYSFNLNRQILLDKHGTSAQKFINLFSLGDASLRGNQLNQFYINIQDFNKQIILESYFEATNNFNLLTKAHEIQTLPNDLKSSLLLNGYFLMNMFGKNSFALKMLEEALSLTAQDKYTYLHAKTARFVATIFAQNNIIDKAISYQHEYLHGIENIPEEELNYIEGLVTLAEFFDKYSKKDIAYTYAVKAYHLFEAIPEKIQNQYELRQRIAKIYLNSKNYRVASVILKKNYEFFLTTKDNQYIFDSGVLYADSLIGENKTQEATTLIKHLENLKNINKNIENSNDQINLLKSKFYFKTNDFEKAYHYLEKSNLKDQDVIEENQTDNPKTITPSRENERTIDINLIDRFIETNNQIIEFAFYLFLLVILILLLIIVKLYHYYKKMKRDKENYDDNERFLQNTVLPSKQDFMNYIRSYNVNLKLENEKNSIDYEKQIFHVYLPGLSNLNITIGEAHASFVYNILKSNLKDINNSTTNLFQLSTERYIIIKDKDDECTISESCEKIFEELKLILKELRVKSLIYIGIIDIPFGYDNFIINDSSKVLELSLIALNGATILSKEENSWLKLSLQNKFNEISHKSEIRQYVLDGFRKNYIIAIGSESTKNIDWELILEPNN